MTQSNSQKQFLIAVHDVINLWENSNSKKERERMVGVAMSILLILDGKHKNHKYKLIDAATGEVISGNLFDDFSDVDPYKALREFMNL